jgi:hypothetical protein
MQVQFDKVYEFNLTASFGPLSQSMVNKLFKDGRVASKFLEHSVPGWFPELSFVDASGYDHIDANGVKYDLKGFTKGGAKYAPSNMIGAGRKINKELLHEHAHSINYIFSDITEFPKVRLIFKRGSEMVCDYPEGNIKPNQKSKLFS